MVHLQIKPEPLGLVLALVGYELSLDDYAELLLRELLDLRTLLWRTNYPFELVHILHSGNCKVSKVRPLKVVIYDPDFLWIFNRKSLARVDCQCVTEAPVVCLYCSFRCFDCYTLDVVED